MVYLKQITSAAELVQAQQIRHQVFVEEQGIETHHELEKWLKLCLAFNPLAKKSKK